MEPRGVAGTGLRDKEKRSYYRGRRPKGHSQEVLYTGQVNPGHPQVPIRAKESHKGRQAEKGWPESRLSMAAVAASLRAERNTGRLSPTPTQWMSQHLCCWKAWGFVSVSLYVCACVCVCRCLHVLVEATG